MKVIELQGDPGKGKSTTMRLLYAMLFLNRFERISKEQPIKPAGKDFSAILERDGVKIGFMTFGDFVSHQKEHLRILRDDFGCAFTLTASRPFRSWKIQDNYPGSRLVLKKVIADDWTLARHEANVGDALKMYDELMSLLASMTPKVP